MTEKQLLELAAKAVGIKLDYRCGSDAYYYDDLETGSEQWKPLSDDGQAFRLAIKLKLSMYHLTYQGNEVAILIEIFNPIKRITETCDKGANYKAAVRRAIVRAAAEIGKAKGGA